MNAVLLFILGAVALLFFFDGLATIISAGYHKRRQKILGLAVKAPAHVDERKYYWTNRLFAGLCTMGAGLVVLTWIFQFLKP